MSNGSKAEIIDFSAEVPIYAAGRISRALWQKLSLNILTAFTGPDKSQVVVQKAIQSLSLSPAHNYSILRAKLALGGSSYIGILASSVIGLGSGALPSSAHNSFSQSFDGRWVRRDGMYRAYFQLASAQRVDGNSYHNANNTSPRLTSSCLPFCVKTVPSKVQGISVEPVK